MNDQQNPNNEAIEEFIKANFGDELVSESILLVKKDQANVFQETLRGAGIPVVALLSKMADHNIKTIESTGQNPEDFWQVHVLAKEKDTASLMRALQNSEMNSQISLKAQAIVDFYTNNGSSNGTLQ